MPTEIPDTTLTREETYLAAANGQEVELPDPLTREEAYLYEIATKMQGGGGGGATVEPLSVTENGVYTAPTGKAYSPVTVAVPGVTIPAGIEVGSFTVASNANTITVNHSFGHVPKIAAVIAALPEGWRNTLLLEYLGASPENGDYSDEYAAGQKLNSVTSVSLISGTYSYQTTQTYTTYPAAMTETSITFATGRYYGAQFVPGVTYFYVIGG